MRFIAVYLETANPRMGSICQIGFVRFKGGGAVGAGMSDDEILARLFRLNQERA